MRSVPRRLIVPGAWPAMAAFWTSRVCAPWRRCIFQTKAERRLFLRADSGYADILDLCTVRFGDGGPTFAGHPVMTRCPDSSRSRDHEWTIGVDPSQMLNGTSPILDSRCFGR